MTYNQFRAKQRRLRKEEKERAERLRYYKEHEEEIELGRKAAILLAVLSRISYLARYLTVMDILIKIDSVEELNFYYAKICERSNGNE